MRRHFVLRTVLAAIVTLTIVLGLFNSTSLVEANQLVSDEVIRSEVEARIRMVYGEIDEDRYQAYFDTGYQLRLIELSELAADNSCSEADKTVDPMRYFIIDDPVLYARYLTRQYALQWYNGHNPSFPSWEAYGGDCANFASQCLYAGGKDMLGTSGAQNAQNTANWFSYGTSCNTSNVSESWRSATGFFSHWSSRAVTYSVFSTSQMGINGDAYNYAQSGDVVSLMRADGTIYHTMVVVGKYGGNLYLAAHTSSTNDATLASKIGAAQGGCVIYNVFGN